MKLPVSNSGKKIAHSMVIAGTAAVLAVYAAGYTRTRAAASQLDAQSDQRRPGAPASRGPAPVAINSPAGSAATVESATQIQSPSPAALTREEHAPPKQVASLGQTPAMVTAPAPPAPVPTTSTPIQEAPSPAPAPVAPPVPAPVTPAPAVVASVTPPTPAQAAPAAAQPAAAQPAAKWKDGTYTGWGTCRHGDIQAEVIVADGRITSAKIAQCLTRYSCDVIGRLPPQVLQRQSAEVDYVSGATQSANAFYYAVTDALNKAK